MSFGFLMLLVCVPREVLQDLGPYPVLALVVGALFGAAVPDAFERERTTLSALLGGRGRLLAELVAGAGYTRSRYTHSLFAAAVVGLVLSPTLFFLGPIPGAALLAGALLGWLAHLVVEIAYVGPSESVPLFWPVSRRPVAGLGLSHGRLVTTRFLVPAGAYLLVGAALAGTLFSAGFGAAREVVRSAELAAGAAPGELADFVASRPAAVLGFPFYALVLWFGGAVVAPRLYRRVLISARDHRGDLRDLKGWSIIGVKGQRLDAALLQRLLETLPMTDGPEDAISLEYAVGEAVEPRIVGRNLTEFTRQFAPSYVNAAVVRPLEPEEAAFYPRRTSKNSEGEHTPLRQVILSYGLDGEAPELGLRTREEVVGEDPLAPALATIRESLRWEMGEQAQPRFALRPVPAGRREELQEKLSQYEPLSRAETDARREADKDARWESRRAKDRNRGRLAGSGNLVFRVLVWKLARSIVGLPLALLLLLVGALLGRRSGRGRRRDLEDRPEKPTPEAAILRSRLKSRLFEARVDVVVYLADDEAFEGRLAQVRMALRQSFAFFGRDGDCHLVEKDVREGFSREAAAKGGGAKGGRAKGVKSLATGAAADLRIPRWGGLGAGRGGRPDLMSASEVVALWRLLGTDVELEGRAETALIVKPPSPRLSRNGLVVGMCNHPAHPGRAIRVGVRDWRTHWVLRGPTGVGKTAMQYLLCMQALTNPGLTQDKMGLFVLDPSRSLIDSLVLYYPRHRVEDLVLFDPAWRGKFSEKEENKEGAEPPDETSISDLSASGSACPSYNFFEPHPWMSLEDLADMVVSELEGLFRASFGNRMKPRLAKTCLALIAANYELMQVGMEPKFTLLDLMETRFLEPKIETGKAEYEVPPVRAEVLSYLRENERWSELVDYWEKRDRVDSAKDQADSFGPIHNIAQQFSSPRLAAVVGAPRRDFDFYQMAENGGVLLVCLDEGVLPTDVVRIIGTLFTELYRRAGAARYSHAMSRGIDDEQLREFVGCIDEVQTFEGQELDTLYTKGRKWALPLIAGHQYAKQLSDRLQSAFANASNRAFFQATDQDRKSVADAINDPLFTPGIMGSYPKHHFVLKTGSEIVTCETLRYGERTPEALRWGLHVRQAAGRRVLGPRFSETSSKASGEVFGETTSAESRCLGAAEPRNEGRMISGARQPSAQPLEQPSGQAREAQPGEWGEIVHLADVRRGSEKAKDTPNENGDRPASARSGLMARLPKTPLRKMPLRSMSGGPKIDASSSHARGADEAASAPGREPGEEPAISPEITVPVLPGELIDEGGSTNRDEQDTGGGDVAERRRDSAQPEQAEPTSPDLQKDLQTNLPPDLPSGRTKGAPG